MTEPEPNGMGPPHGWATSHAPTKIFLVPPSTAACLQASSCSAPYNVGLAFQSSGAIVINEEVSNASYELDAVLGHEFFHILEYAQAPRLPDIWLTEASADWAETVYVPQAEAAAAFFPPGPDLTLSYGGGALVYDLVPSG